MYRALLSAFFLSLLCVAPAFAQNNEVSFSAGGGGLIGNHESRSASAYTLAYDRNLTNQLAVEGSLEFFYVDVPNFGRDDYTGVQGAVLYHFRSGKDQRFVPYLTAGVGNTTTDFTEIPSALVIRLGGGFKYFFGASQRFGLRVEARDEIIGKNTTIFYPQSHIQFPSARAGIVYRW